ncbi:urea ABC transporter permease subunit UrtB [Photobacterium aquimaris]|uniref:High-affinity branched-chain amino acid transport system permease protein LivH n=1 Tax=Photobacterium aquimaris TaxID=512643 RepID=A0A1Y6L0G2_9GAMM|nr:High-affinity branched-chain amino acid transport system permease protein LivH [Photobacterium aquimaris]
MKYVFYVSFFICLISLNVHAAIDINSYSSFVSTIEGKNNDAKVNAISWLSKTDNTQRQKIIFSAWIKGQLYINKKDNRLYKIERVNEKTHSFSIGNGKNTIILNKKGFKKIRVNNKLRNELKMRLAILNLKDKTPSIREKAIKVLMDKVDFHLYTLMKKHNEVEKNANVKQQYKLAFANYQARNSLGEDQLNAVVLLGKEKHPIVYQTLMEVVTDSKNPQVVAAAKYGLDTYKQQQRIYAGVETVFFGLSLGSVLALAGIGLAITFGVMGVINMAHGELIMLGAYTTYVLQQLMPNHLAIALILSIPAAFIVSGCIGIMIEQGVIRHLYGRPLETLLATFGISLILQQAVRTVFSPLNRSVITPEFMSGALTLNPMLMLTYNRLYIIFFCFAVFLLLLTILKKTPLGLQVRAVSQNRPMARAMGIHSQRVDALTFGLGSGIAGIAGVALSQLTNVGPNMGQSYIIDSFMVVVFGGVGNLWGTLVAGLSLGIFNKFLEPWFGAVLAKIIVLIFIILFIQKKPKGLFPQRGRAADS